MPPKAPRISLFRSSSRRRAATCHEKLQSWNPGDIGQGRAERTPAWTAPSLSLLSFASHERISLSSKIHFCFRSMRVLTRVSAHISGHT